MDNPIIQALRRARQAYMTNVGEPTAQLVGGGVRGYLGLDAPEYADSRGMEAYRNAQALGNAPGVGAPAGAFKAMAAAPLVVKALRKAPKNTGPAYGAYGYTDDLIRRERGSFASNYGIDFGEALTNSFDFVPVNKLVPTEKVDESRVRALMQAMKESGNTLENKIPPVIVDSRGGVLDGHHRLEAARRMGFESVPVIEKFDRRKGPMFVE